MNLARRWLRLRPRRVDGVLNRIWRLKSSEERFDSV
jgi:hypothetical protein